MATDFPLRFLPFGGLGEIGLNLMLVRYGQDSYAIDCGLMFPESGSVGAELVLPDLEALKREAPDLRGVFLTHGHEDHIGAVPFLLREMPVPVYGPRFALELVRQKLTEHRIPDDDVLRPLGPGETLSLGPLRFEPIRTTHSVPDTQAYLLHTPVGAVLYTSDFKLDPWPLDGAAADLERIRAAGDEGLLALFSDSTNAERAGRAGSERALRDELRSIVQDWKGRVIVTQFASNLYRLRSLYGIAQETERAFVLVGRSLHSYVGAARRAGIEVFPEGTNVAPGELPGIPPEKQLIVMTGSQGESRSALLRAAVRTDDDIRLGEGDLVVLSSRIIPGNEGNVGGMIDRLVRRGVRVVHERTSPVHVSGHACREELAEMLRLARPRLFVPIHGSRRFLEAHAELARTLGIGEPIVIEDGEELGIERAGASILRRVHLESRFVDGPVVGTYDELLLKERLRLAWNGVVGCRVRVKNRRAGLDADVELQASGAHTLGGSLLEEAREAVREAVEALPAGWTQGDIVATAEREVRRSFRRRVLKKPVVMVFVETADDGGEGT